MKSTSIAQLTYHKLPTGRKLLVGHVRSTIEAGSVLALTRDGDAETYTLHCATADDKDRRCPSNLASFLPPEAVDEIERHHAAQLATEAKR